MDASEPQSWPGAVVAVTRLVTSATVTIALAMMDLLPPEWAAASLAPSALLGAGGLAVRMARRARSPERPPPPALPPPGP